MYRTLLRKFFSSATMVAVVAGLCGCATTPEQPAALPPPNAPADKALVYIYRKSYWSMTVDYSVRREQEFMGNLSAGQWFYCMTAPGTNRFASKIKLGGTAILSPVAAGVIAAQDKDTAVISVNLDAGKTYYLRMHSVYGVLEQVNEQTARQEMQRCKARPEQTTKDLKTEPKQ